MNRNFLNNSDIANVFAIQFKPELWGFIRVHQGAWGVWDVCSNQAEMPMVGPRPESWFFSGIVTKDNATEFAYIGTLPFLTEDDSWAPPTHQRFTETSDVSLVFYRGEGRYEGRYLTRAQVEAEGIAQVTRGALKHLADKLAELYEAGLLTLVEPAPPGTTGLIPPPAPKASKSKKEAVLKPKKSRAEGSDAKAQFDSEGYDRTTFAPFVLQDCGDSDNEEVRLIFSNWEWLHQKCGGDSVGDYYLNGPGVEGLVMATRQMNKLTPDPETMDPNSEGDACCIHFTDFDEAILTAKLCAEMIQDRKLIRKAAKISEENGWGD